VRGEKKTNQFSGDQKKVQTGCPPTYVKQRTTEVSIPVLHARLPGKVEEKKVRPKRKKTTPCMA